MKAKLFPVLLVAFLTLSLAQCGPTPIHFVPQTLDPSQLAFQTQAAEWTKEPPKVTPTPSVDTSAPQTAGSFPGWTYYAGSPNNHNHIAIDPTSRYIWAATEAGVVQFDIQTALYVIYNRGNGLPDNEVMDIAITPDGKVWAGTTFGGLAVFEGTRWKWYTTQNGLPGDGVSELNVSSDGKLWVGYTNGGVSRFDGSQWIHWTQAEGLGTDEVTFIDLNDPEKPVAYSTSLKYFYNGAAWSYSDFPPNGYTIMDVALSKDGTQWFAASSGPNGKGGVVQIKAGKATLYSNRWPIRGTHAFGMAIDNKGILWIGTDQGLVRFDGKSSWVTYTTVQGLPSNVIHDVAVTLEGVLWAATDRGLANMGRNAYRWVILTADEIQEDRYSLPINALAFDSTNVLWITYSDGIHRLEGTNATFFEKSVVKFTQDLNAILPAPDGTVWFIGASQIARYTSGNWKIFYSSTGFPFKTIEAYAMDASGRLWIGENRSVAYYENNKWTKMFIPADIPIQPSSLSSIAVGEDGTVWVGTPEGLYQYRDGAWSYVEVFTAKPVHSITPVPGGQIWAVAGENAVVYDGANWMMYEGGGVFTEPIEKIAVGRDGKIFFIMATRFVIFDGKSSKVTGRAEGFPGGKITAVTFGEDNSVWFGSDYGMAVYHPD